MVYFFKVVLILKDIEDKERVPAVLEAIEQSPPALDKLIEHVFEKLLKNEDVNKEDLQEMLIWVAFAKRPLRIAELYYILKISNGKFLRRAGKQTQGAIRINLQAYCRSCHRRTAPFARRRSPA